MVQLRERVLVAMSGGVDSAVAAALLVQEGHEVVGVTLHLWDAEGAQKVGRCCSPEDQDDARRVCEQLGVPHVLLDERSAFAQQVVDPLVDAYRRGETPSPCVHCNSTVKLAALLEVADRLGAKRIATGHYARLEPGPDGQLRLLQGRDAQKDQSYFLFALPPALLARLCFPLGGMTKAEVRALARGFALPNADKRDSQQLCFIPDGDVAGFVAGRVSRRSAEAADEGGEVCDPEGKPLAKHAGIAAFTVGQRRGLGIGDGKQRYVLRIVPESRRVVVGQEQALWSQDLKASQARWLQPPPPVAFEAQARIRYRHTAAPALVTPTADGFSLRFAEAQRAITPGQAAVLYRDDVVIGGGFIVA